MVFHALVYIFFGVLLLLLVVVVVVVVVLLLLSFRWEACRPNVIFGTRKVTKAGTTVAANLCLLGDSSLAVALATRCDSPTPVTIFGTEGKRVLQRFFAPVKGIVRKDVAPPRDAFESRPLALSQERRRFSGPSQAWKQRGDHQEHRRDARRCAELVSNNVCP